MRRFGQILAEVLAVLAVAAMGVVAVVQAAAAEDVASNAFLRENLRSIGEEVAAYRPILVSLGKDGRSGRDSREALARIDALLAEARRLAQETKLAEAVRQGEQAKRLAIETMVRLKSGETVTHSLKFDTPADEYAYELRRFDSNAMMVAMNLEEKGDTGLRGRVAAEMDAAGRLKAEAAGEAAAGRHGEAVKRMETASGHLTRALQVLGVPVF